MAVTLNSLAQAFLPVPLYQRLASSPMARRLARGSLWSLFGSAVSRVLVVISMVLVARVLGRISFGELGLIQSTLGVVGLMAGLGLGSTATRFVAQFASTDPVRAGRLIALITLASTGAVLLSAVALIAVSDLLARTVMEAPHLRGALIWGVLLMIATAVRGIQMGVFAGLERFDVIAKLSVLDGLISLASMVALAHAFGIDGALLGLSLSGFISWTLGQRFMKAGLNARGIAVQYRGCWTDWRILTSFSLPSLLAGLVATPVLWLAMMLVARSEHGFAALGTYNAAYQWHGPLMFIPMILMSVSIPALVQEWEAGRNARFRALTLGVCGLLVAISLPLAIIAALLSPWIMSLYGPEFRDGWRVLVLLLAAVPMHGISKIATGALMAMNRAWWVLLANVFWGASLIGLALLLVQSAGALGLAASFFLAHTLTLVMKALMFAIGSSDKGQISQRRETSHERPQ